MWRENRVFEFKISPALNIVSHHNGLWLVKKFVNGYEKGQPKFVCPFPPEALQSSPGTLLSLLLT